MAFQLQLLLHGLNFLVQAVDVRRGQHQGFATVAEAAKFGKAATPQFAVLEYSIEKRGGYLPVTNELLEDSRRW